MPVGQESDHVVRRGDVRLSFSATDGALVGLGWADSSAEWGGHGERTTAADACLKGHGWVNSLFQAELVGINGEESQVTVVVRCGPILLEDTYVVGGNLIERRMRVTNQGVGEAQLEKVLLAVPWVRIGELGDCRFEAPGNTTRPRLPLHVAARQRVDGPTDTTFAPGIRWGRRFETAPDAGPGLLAVHNEREGESLLVWYYSEVESSWPEINGNGDAVSLMHRAGLAGWLAPGQSLETGTQYILLHRGTWDEALAAYRGCQAREGLLPTLYGDAPAWVREAAIYEAHPSQHGGFRGLADALPRLRDIGFDVLYLMPIWEYDNRKDRLWDLNWKASGSPYAMRDFERFARSLGTPHDFRYLVGEAHRLDMRVLLDFVAQGCAIDARYVAEHPEWMARDEKGKRVSSHGWIDTYSFDWANPEFHDYMLDWALDLVREYGIDGYRVDAPHGKEPNWDRTIPYHASYTSLGVIRLLERLQRGLKEINPQAALLCELYGPVYVKSHDFCYDYLPHHMTHYLAIGKLVSRELGEWLKDHRACLPEGAVRVCFTETHDTRDTTALAMALRGSLVHQAEAALLVLAGFVPMVWSGEERGLEEFYARLLRVRSANPALIRGDHLYNAVSCDDPQVFNLIRRCGEQIIVGLINFSPHKKALPLGLPIDALGVGPRDSYGLIEVLAGMEWDENGRRFWMGTDLRDFVLTLEPYRPYFLELRKHPWRL